MNDFFAAVKSMLSKKKKNSEWKICVLKLDLLHRWALCLMHFSVRLPYSHQFAIDLLEKKKERKKNKYKRTNERLQNNSYAIVDVDSYWRVRKVMSKSDYTWTAMDWSITWNIQLNRVKSSQLNRFIFFAKSMKHITRRHYYVLFEFL